MVELDNFFKFESISKAVKKYQIVYINKRGETLSDPNGFPPKKWISST